MWDQSNSREDTSDSDEEVPVVQLCCLPLAHIQTLDLSTNNDFCLLLEVLAVGGEVRALAALSQICTQLEQARYGGEPIPTVIIAGGVDILYRAMKHESEQIRVKAILAIAQIFFKCRCKQWRKVYKYDCIVTLVELINSDESWRVKENAILALGNMPLRSTSVHVCSRVCEAGGITAILNNLHEDSPTYMQTVCRTLNCLLRDSYCSHSYLLQVAPFIMSHLNAFDDIPTRICVFRMLGKIVLKCVNEIGLNEGICVSLVQWIDTAQTYMSDQIITALTNIISATSEYTELFIEHGLLRKMQELLMCCHYFRNWTISSCLNVLSIQTADIVDKVVLSGIIPQVICILNSKLALQGVTIMEVLGNICTNCSLMLIPKLLEMDIVQHLVKGLLFAKNYPYDAVAMKEITEGLKGIIRYAKEMSNPELLESYINVEGLAKTCRELVKGGKHRAKSLLRDVLWLMANSERSDTPKKKHKSVN